MIWDIYIYIYIYKNTCIRGVSTEEARETVSPPKIDEE